MCGNRYQVPAQQRDMPLRARAAGDEYTNAANTGKAWISNRFPGPGVAARAQGPVL